ncbi:hypothetical protein KI387_043703 [Taxus chinensis]|uniref:Uncharacterized protein n=1 Tax=Taxus chinensis TaxID=29808 RepID=A0AA38LSN4_TAXCH|nr:hypothetical protein KI387_043703 [Taxus chinensis]
MEISLSDKGKKVILQGMLPDTPKVKHLVEDTWPWESPFCSLSKTTADWRPLITAKHKFANVVLEIDNERSEIMVGIIHYKDGVYLASKSKVENMIVWVVHDAPWNDHPSYHMRHKKGEEKDFSFDFSLCLWKENSSMICLRQHKLDGNSDFLLYESLSHGSMNEPKEVWEKGSNYDKLAAVHMATKKENNGSIFQFYDPMMRYGFCFNNLVFISAESHNVCGYQELQILEELALKIHMEFGLHLKNDEIKIHRNAKRTGFLKFKAKITVDFNCRPVVPNFSSYANQISVPTLLVKLSFFVRFQFGGCYAIIIGLNLQKSDLGLPLTTMSSSVFPFLESIPSYSDVT